MKVDIKIKGERVIDPSQNLDAVKDVLAVNGKIVTAPTGEAVETVQEIDASGCIVTPGLIDFHNHIFAKHKNTLLGLKVRISKEVVAGQGLEPLKKTIEIAAEIGVPVCVHTTNAPAPVEDLLSLLRPDDIFYHVFHGTGETIIGNTGKLKSAVKDAQKRGVVFDARQVM